MQLSNITYFAKRMLTGAAVCSVIGLLQGCVLVTDERVNSKTSLSQESARLTREGLSALSRSKLEEATLQFLKASARTPDAQAVLGPLATAHIELGDIEAAKLYISKLRYQDGIPVRAQSAYANAQLPRRRKESAQELYGLAEQLLVHRDELQKIGDYDPVRNAAALMSQSYHAFYDAGLYSDALCALKGAYELAPTPAKASALFSLMIALGHTQQAALLAADPYFRSNRDLTGAADLIAMISTYPPQRDLGAEMVSSSSGILSATESEGFSRLRKIVTGEKIPSEVEDMELFVAPPEVLLKARS